MFWKFHGRRLLSDEDSILSAGAVALSASATVAGLIITLKNKAILSDDDERRLHELALTMLKVADSHYSASRKQLNRMF
jgi:hypothetical protein